MLLQKWVKVTVNYNILYLSFFKKAITNPILKSRDEDNKLANNDND